MVYSVVLVAQQDRHLRQIADQEKYLECVVEEDAFSIESKSMLEVVKNELMERHGKNQRSGRMKKEDVDEDFGEEMDEALSASRAWMEITPEEDGPSGTLKVGEVAILSLKSTLPAGIGWKVVECVAHDGLGDSSQKLLDDDGCPVDELLLPTPQMGPVQPISLMRHQEAVSRFAAFKFPDRDRLHLSCYLELCRGSCAKVNLHNRVNLRLCFVVLGGLHRQERDSGEPLGTDLVERGPRRGPRPVESVQQRRGASTGY